MRDLKARMSHREWLGWIDYFNRNGRLTPERIHDRTAAMICYQISAALGGKAKYEDFLYKRREKASNMDSLASVIKQFGGAKRGRSR